MPQSRPFCADVHANSLSHSLLRAIPDEDHEEAELNDGLLDPTEPEGAVSPSQVQRDTTPQADHKSLPKTQWMNWEDPFAAFEFNDFELS